MQSLHRARRVARPTLRSIGGLSLVLIAWTTLACASASAQRPSTFRPLRGQFANPPLRYHGPDPTADYFLPSDHVLAASATGFANAPTDRALGQLPPPQFSGWPAVDGPVLPAGFAPSHEGPTYVVADEFAVPPAPGRGPSAAMESYLDEPLPDEAYLGLAGEMPRRIREHKDGFFQKLSFTATWIPRNDKPDDFGETEVDLFATFALPAPSREWPLLITPAFNTRLLSGPETADVPPRVYETYLDFTWVPRLSARWTAIVGVAPGIWSDFETSADAFRITGKVLARYDWKLDQVQLVFGVLYLDRYDITWLPAGGIIWSPTAGRTYELLFPRPKLAHRVRYTATFEDWVYLGGEIGGNSYATDSVGAITLRGFRAYLGVERRFDGGAGFRLEAGYVFGREIEFESALPLVEADDTAMIRGGFTY